MNDIFKNNLTIGSYIIYPINSSMTIAKIVNIKHNNIIQIVTTTSSYYYRESDGNNTILITEENIRNMSDKIDYINILNDNIIAIEKYTLEQSLVKQQELDKQKELQKTSEPFCIYKGKNYRNIYMYLGQNDSKQHVYCDIKQSSRYDASTRIYNYIYEFNTNPDTFMYTSKTKKLPTEKVDINEYNITNMITQIKNELIERNRRNLNNYSITINDIDNLEKLYNKR